MEQKELLVKSSCKHVWMDLGFSSFNGKRYRRCVKCGFIKEDTLPHIV
ncbi:MAG: hypothetical protein ACE5NN_03040 [Candidatus Bathyarchaeia archaeon]